MRPNSRARTYMNTHMQFLITIIENNNTENKITTLNEKLIEKVI